MPGKSVKDKLKHDFDSSMVKVGFENQDVKKKIAGPPLCAKHGLPVLASRLLARCRTSGCTQCEWDRRNIRRKQTTVPSPKLRKCKRHGLPITPYYWRVGYRTKGCTQCGNERRHQTEAATKVPTPANRLCKRHGRAILPSRWKRGCRSTGCSLCPLSREREFAQVIMVEVLIEEMFGSD